MNMGVLRVAIRGGAYPVNDSLVSVGIRFSPQRIDTPNCKLFLKFLYLGQLAPSVDSLQNSMDVPAVVKFASIHQLLSDLTLYRLS